MSDPDATRDYQPRPEPESIPPGTEFGQFTVVKELKSGGLGRVFLATDGERKTDKDRLAQTEAGVAVQDECIQYPYEVVLKFIKGDPTANDLKRFRREVIALQRLSDTNIVPIWGTGVVGWDSGRWVLAHYEKLDRQTPAQDGLHRPDPDAGSPTTSAARTAPFFVMPYYPIGDLKAWRSRILRDTRKPVEAAESNVVPQGDTQQSSLRKHLSRDEIRLVLRILRDVSRAVHLANTYKIFHRDIKPGNILIGGSLAAPVGVLIDFGVAKWGNDEFDDMTASGDRPGTRMWMAPDLLNSGVPNVRSDVYAVGASLYWAVTGKIPYWETEPSPDQANPEIGSRPQKGQPLAARSFNPNSWEFLDEVLDICLSPTPEHRYESCHALAEDLDRLARGTPPLGRKPGMWRRFHVRFRTDRLFRYQLAAMILGVFSLFMFAAMWWLEVDRRQRAEKLVLSERQRQKDAQLGEAKAVTQRGLERCRRGDVGGGLVLLAEALRLCPPEFDETRLSIRRQTDAWLPYAHELRGLTARPEYWPEVGDTGATAVIHNRPEAAVTLIERGTGRIKRFDGDGRPVPLPEDVEKTKAICLSEDGECFVAVTQQGDNRVKLTCCDSWTGRAIGSNIEANTDAASGVVSATISQNHSCLCVREKLGDRMVRVFLADVTNGTSRWQKEFKASHPKYLLTVFSPDSRHLLVSDGSDWVSLIETGTGKVLDVCPEVAKSVPVVARFHPVRSVVASANAVGDVFLWDFSTQRVLQTIRNNQAKVTSLAFTVNGLHLAVGSSDGSARVFNAVGESTAQVRHETRIGAIRFLPTLDKPTFLTGSFDQTVSLWDMLTGNRVGGSIRHNGQVGAIRAGTWQGQPLVLSEDYHYGRLWRPSQELPKPLVLSGHGSIVTLTPDQGGATLYVTENGECATWDIVTGKRGPAVTLKGTTSPLGNFLAQMPAVAAGRYVLNSNGTDLVILFDLTTGAQVGEPIRANADVIAVAIDPKGERAAFGYPKGQIELWDLQTRRPLLPKIQLPHAARQLSFSRDGQCIRSYATQLDARTGRQIGQAIQPGYAINAVEFSPNGRLVLTAGASREVHLWNAETGERLHTLNHDDDVKCVTFNNAGSRFATGGRDRGVRVWDTGTGTQQGNTAYHDDVVNAVTFSPDDQLLASASSDRRVCLWEVASGHLIGPPLWHDDLLTGVRFDSEGRRVTTWGLRGAYSWPVPETSPKTLDADRFLRVVSVRTGMGLDHTGEPRLLTREELEQARREPSR